MNILCKRFRQCCCRFLSESQDESLIGSQAGVSLVSLDAREQAVACVGELVRNCDALGQLHLPEGSAQLLATIRSATSQLEGKLGAARPGLKCPWGRALPEEQAEWEQICPEGGCLIRAQVCFAANKDAESEEIAEDCCVGQDEEHAKEWCIGQLFASTSGILFASARHDALNTGLLHWEAIESIQCLESASKEPDGQFRIQTVFLTLHPCASPSQLWLKVGSKMEASWLEDAWRFCLDAVNRRCTLDIDSSGPSRQVRVCGLSFHSLADFDSDPDLDDLQVTAPHTESFFAACSALPAETTIRNSMDTKPLKHEVLPNASFAKMRAALEDPSEQWPIFRFMKEMMGCTLTSWVPWAECPQISGALVRRVSYDLPMPQDLPKAVSRLIGAPTHAQVTSFFRLHSNDEEVVLVQLAISKGVPFSQNLRLEDTLVLRPHDGGGVSFTKWTRPVWQPLLPVFARPVQWFVDMKVRSDALSTAGPLARILQEAE